MRRPLAIFSLLLLALVALAGLRLCVGSTFGWPGGHLPDSIARVFAGDWMATRYSGVLQIRTVEICVAIVAGVALSTSGVALQTLLRNPLAEPFILGLSGGAAVGYIGQQMLHKWLQRPLAPLHVGAILGGIVTLGVVYLAGRRRGVVDPLGMLLTGVVLSAFNGAIIMILYHFNTEGDMSQLARWMQGYLKQNPGSLEMVVITLLTFAGLGLLLIRSRAMDAALFSDGEAIALGVNLPALRTQLFLIAGVLASGAVVLAGPLAFVGLIGPHIARLLLGPSHRNLLIAAALLGALLILLASTVMATIQQRQFPVGVFTAIVGGPLFLSMLRKRMGRE
jgi:iron complex transport system permease protein